MPNIVTGMICRSTLIPQNDDQRPLVATQPVSLASHLVEIRKNASLTDLYTTGGFDAEGNIFIL